MATLHNNPHSANFYIKIPMQKIKSTPVNNNIGLYDTPSITSDILWHQLVPHY
jgi:hypothetical protein